METNGKEAGMASVNRATLIGNLGRDPEVRFTPSGTKVTTLSLATNARWKAAGSNEVNERTEWHRVVVWGRQAEVVAEHCKKGSQLYVEGPLQTRSWVDKDGAKRYSTGIVARRVQLLGKAEKVMGPVPEAVEAPASQEPEVPEDDIPF